VVVDLAVVGSPDRAVFVRQRLVAAGKVDDAQAPMGKQCVRVCLEAGAIRTAVREDVAHSHDPHRVVRMQTVSRDNASNSAHGPSVEQAECHGIAENKPSPSSDRGGSALAGKGQTITLP
jgi:hypothetical protein